MTSSDGHLGGYVHTKDLLANDPGLRAQPIHRELIRPLPVVARTDALRPVLETMRNTGAHLAAVSENGLLIGIVTLEDVLAELVGQIRGQARGAS